MAVIGTISDCYLDRIRNGFPTRAKQRPQAAVHRQTARTGWRFGEDGAPFRPLSDLASINCTE